jgi:NADPH:quinone reductase-like Zn-dependent oxidoreductase
MRAIAVDRFKAEPRLLEVAQPVPKSDQLLVKIAATALNPFDWKVADGIMGAMPAVFPLILGQDAAGTVSAVGADVTRFKTGDRLFGQFFHAPVGEGTFAEYAVVPQTAPLAVLPPQIDFASAAALPTAGMTALSMVETLGLKGQADVLIVGATGGVGSFATQLAAANGLRVLATASSPSDADRLRRLGASEVYASRNEALIADVRGNHPQGIDGIIDLVSDMAALNALAGLLHPGGTVLTTVFSADEKALAARGLKGGNFEVRASSSLLERLADIVKAGKLTVPIESKIDLAEAPAAIARSRAGHSKGKTIILPAPAP